MASRPAQVSASPSQRMGPETFKPSRRTCLWWLTNAGFLINARGTLAMIDPVISLDSDAPQTSETGMRLLVPLPLEVTEVPRLDVVLYTHADDDHFARATAKTLFGTEALFVGPPPVARELAEMGLSRDRIRAASVEETVEVGHVSITPTPADHPWQLSDPEQLGEPWKPGDCCGYLIDTPDGRIWCPGDTRLMDEHVQLRDVDVLLLDVGRNEYHLGVDNAARLANILDPPHIIPYHWGTYDAPEHAAYNGDPAEVRERLHNPDTFHVLAPGEESALRP
jgi:L-ascorbate metabolism protein UlaG (beta-lactamase superfamily)